MRSDFNGTEGEGLAPGERSVSFLWPALALAAACLFSGCAGRHLYSLDTRYEKTRLPVHFDRETTEDEDYASLTIGRRKAETFAYRNADSTPISALNAAYTVDGSLLLESGAHHVGLGVGFSPVDHGLIRLGGFWGHTQKVGPLLSSLGAGFFLNTNFNDARYEDWEFLAYEGEEGSSHGLVAHMEVPLRAGLAYDGPWGLLPYVNYSVSFFSIGPDNAERDLVAQEIAAGTSWEARRGHAVQIEASMMASRIDENSVAGTTHTGLMPGLRIAYIKKLR
jgi:hypothetical protein